MNFRQLSALAAFGIGFVLTSCQVPQSPGQPFSNLPPGVIRGPDGTLILDPRGAAQGQSVYAPRDVISYWSGDAGNVVDNDVDIKTDPVPRGLRYEGADMNNFMRLTNTGIGMHAGYLPGYPASHSCIRMPAHMSEHFFNSVSEGTPVTIVP